MPSDREDTINSLMEFGFTEYESKVYLSLLTSHPASAYTISQNSDVPHSRVYDIARRLVKKGIAIASGKNPEKYSPLAPEELVDKLQRDSERHTKTLQAKLQRSNFQSDFDPVWNLHSREESFDMAKSLIKKAEDHIFIGLWAEDFGILEKDLRKASKKGISIFILIYGELEIDFGEVYFHDIAYLDDTEHHGYTLDLAVDSEACLTGALGGDKNCQVVWTRNKGLVNNIENYIIHDFYLAEISSHYKGEIERVFGANLIELRRKFIKV